MGACSREWQNLGGIFKSRIILECHWTSHRIECNPLVPLAPTSETMILPVGMCCRRRSTERLNAVPGLFNRAELRDA